MSVDHYENFPVASLLLPRALRWPITVIYRFARSADDIADEGNATPAERLAALATYRATLADIRAGNVPATGLFHDLAQVTECYTLPLNLLEDLLSAFEQDVSTHYYDDFQALRDYCARSANPVGRVVLHLAGHTQPMKLQWSDYICTALQLINFWQDVGLDWQKGRVYVPASELTLFDLTPEDIGRFQTGEPCTPRWRELMAFQTKRARKLMLAGAPLIRTLPGRLRWEIALTMEGGLFILDKIDAVRGDVFRQRPTIKTLDWLRLLRRAIRRHQLITFKR